MTQKTNTYKLSYFKRGAYYDAISDSHRFLTLDYNLKKYVGIVGAGIIGGWQIEENGPLSVNILPGYGFIDGFYVESPYAAKYRKDMVIGEREVEVYPNDDSVPLENLDDTDELEGHYHFITDLDGFGNGNLGDSIGAGSIHTHTILANVVQTSSDHTHILNKNRWNYIQVIRDYDSSYNPDGDIENSQIKAVTPYSISLFNNNDNYIYAVRPSGATPYPSLVDYPADPGSPPDRTDYNLFSEYSQALKDYQSRLDAIYNYDWKLNSLNHFTEVQFSVYPNYIKASNLILLGNVVTRLSQVISIDTNLVSNIGNLESTISKFANQSIRSHIHGGGKTFDPVKIRLETDIRQCVLASYDASNGQTAFTATKQNETEVSFGHKHTYIVDSEGNGSTFDQIGSTNEHFHKIVQFVVQNQEFTSLTVQNHTHVIPTNIIEDTWNDDSKYIIYVDGEQFADETSTSASVDPENKKVVLNNNVGVSFSEYSTSFTFNNEIYTFSKSYVTLYSFMLNMIVDFWTKYATVLESTNRSGDPFLFYTDTTNSEIVGNKDLIDQSSAGQLLLDNVGDVFTFTPNAATNIPVTLIKKGGSSDVKIEILDNTEVIGKLQIENIAYIDAEKILTGEFIPEVIPFISHIGRILEKTYPIKYGLLSTDGNRYSVTPSITDDKFDHAHVTIVDSYSNGSGVTTTTVIGSDTVYYANDEDGTSYYIFHAHDIEDGKLKESSSDGLLQWQIATNASSANLTSSVHTHNLIYPVSSNNKIIYSIEEDINGNIYIGTSDKLLLIPYENSYLFTINEKNYYAHGNSLWDTFLDAAAQYELENKVSLNITEVEYRTKVEDSGEKLIEYGDSVFIVGEVVPNRQQNKIMIKKTKYVEFANFGYEQDKDALDVLQTEKIIKIYTEVVEKEDGTTSEEPSGIVRVRRDFDDVPIWSIALKSVTSPSAAYISTVTKTDIVIVGSNLIARNSNLDSNINNIWLSSNIPFAASSLKKMIKSYDGAYWIVTNNGVLVSRSYLNGSTFYFTELPGNNPNLSDIMEGDYNNVYVASQDGIFKTNNGGKTWTQLLTSINGFQKILHDNSFDVSNNINGHYHYVNMNRDGNGFLTESIGNGTSHVHTIENGVIKTTMGHDHSITTRLYAVDGDGKIFISGDSGSNWQEYGLLPSGEYGAIFSQYGSIFVSLYDGLYKTFDGNNWSIVIGERIYCAKFNYAMSSMLLGGENIIYTTSDGIDFEVLHEFDGSPTSVLLNGLDRQYYGYAYSNSGRVFHFYDYFNADAAAALVDYGIWYANEGAWPKDSLYDIYINNKRVYSTKYNEDRKYIENYNFSVESENGTVDFNAESKLSKEINVFDIDIEVKDATKFSVGDNIYISDDINEIFDTIVAINKNTITIATRSSKKILIVGIVRKIANFDADSDIVINIYDSIMSNSGINTHEELEDSMSLVSDGRPYKFNDTYLSNLLQLTQATRYIYPEINSQFIRSKFYDFRYSMSQNDPTYEYIGDFIDIDSTSINSNKVFDSDFKSVSAKSINDILIGFGPFSDNIFVATDIGVFWAKIVDDLESNWFYVNDLRFEVYDLMIYNGDTLFAATSNGTYSTSDMVSWTLENAPSIRYPSHSLSLRWPVSDIVIIPAHEAFFENIEGEAFISSSSGTPYSELKIDSAINISGAGAKNGSYIIIDILDNGNGLGSKMSVSPIFSGESETHSSVQINMSVWWSSWDGDVNTENSNLTNTFIVGGENKISYNNGGDNFTWYESQTNIDDFIVRDIVPLENGIVLATATGNDVKKEENYLLLTKNIGSSWETFVTFSDSNGSILSAELSDFNNTILKVSYIKPLSYIHIDGSLDELFIRIIDNDTKIDIASGIVIWNEYYDNNEHTITVYGNSIFDAILNKENVSFSISPQKVNSIVEINNNVVLFGTNNGIYFDNNTIVDNVMPRGTINSVGVNATVTSIDFSGSILLIMENSVTKNSILIVELNRVARNGELVGNKLYITDTDPMESYNVVSNSSVSVGNEVTIEIDKALSDSYKNRNFVVTNAHSKVFFTSTLPVINGEYDGGKIVITSNENATMGTEYNILSTSSDFVIVDQEITPQSTILGSSKEKTLTNGQTIRFADSSRMVKIYTTFDRHFKDNAFGNLSLRLVNPKSNSTLPDDLSSDLKFIPANIPIYSNTNNSISLNYANSLIFSEGDNFNIIGAVYDRLDGFSFRVTSNVSDHYHNVNMVGDIVSGRIDSFDNHDASFVTINVIDTYNFSNPTVQLSGDLFNDSKIIFTLEESINIRYVAEVMSHNANQIVVKIKSSSMWDFDAFNGSRISEGWKWEIDAINYGYTEGIEYSDFVINGSKITSTFNKNTDIAEVSSSYGMSVGDKVRISDDTLSYDINYIDAIISATQIKLLNDASRTFFISKNPEIKVLANDFPNTHIHQIRNNEVQNISINDYLDLGYPLYHSHRVLPFITDVTSIVKRDDEIVSAGYGSKLYSSLDNGIIWKELIDLNDYLDEAGPSREKVDGVSLMTVDGDRIIVGTTNGTIFVEGEGGNGVVKLESP